ncbi:MAG TPA: YkgJ family cysteine cluster protein [Polyangiaceae bacterium]|nr:YkgJ family cysteine cluster protein [Polyangiaceae bacterium]
MAIGEKYLKFRCTQCGNCCKDPLLPLTDLDIKRITRHTGEASKELVRWVDRNGIDMDDEPEAFVILRPGKRVMVLRHEGGGCRYLGSDNRCTIYHHRPLGCRIFPFDPSFHDSGKLRRLKLIQATDCKYELDGENDLEKIRSLHQKHDEATRAYQAKVASWNALQLARKKRGHQPQTAAAFLAFLGV